MPLKHNSETAYLFVLGVAICLSGFFASLLPSLPLGLPYWVAAVVISILYPLVLQRTFRTNRVDYEFRMLHWFPAGIFVLWMILEFVAPYLRALYILQLGFFFLWSLPLVALGVAFIIFFAVHVMRQSRLRILLASVLFSFFCVGAISAEGMNWNPKIQAAIFPRNASILVTSARQTLAKLRAWVADFRSDSSSGSLVSVTASSSRSYSSAKSNIARSQPAVVASSRASSEPPMVASSRPTHLPSSGPESAGVLAALLLAGYSAVLHRRSIKRV